MFNNEYQANLTLDLTIMFTNVTFATIGASGTQQTENDYSGKKH